MAEAGCLVCGVGFTPTALEERGPWGPWTSMSPLLSLRLAGMSPPAPSGPDDPIPEQQDVRAWLWGRVTPKSGPRGPEGHLPAERCVLPSPSLPAALPTREPLITRDSRCPKSPQRLGWQDLAGQVPVPMAPRVPHFIVGGRAG